MAKVFDLWGLYARVYDVLRSFTPYVKLQARVLDYLELIPNLEVLDLGCGTGNTIEKLVKTKPSPYHLKITGIERSAAMLERARKKLTGFGQVQLEQGSFDVLAACDKRYDRIISVNGLYAAENPLGALRHWHELLADGGLLVVINPFVPRLWPVFQEYFRDLWQSKDFKGFLNFVFRLPAWLFLITINLSIARQVRQRVFHFLPPQTLKQLAEETGFQVLGQELVYGKGSVLLSLQKQTAAPVHRAQRPKELEQAYRLRYDIYCGEIGSLSPLDYPTGMEMDRFDPYAVHFIARIDKQIVGCIRVVPDYGRGFLLEEHFEIPPEIAKEIEREKTLEISRAILLPEARDGTLFFQLLQAAADWGLSHGYSHFVGVSIEKIWNSFLRNGWQLRIWAEYKEYHNTLSAPAIIYPPKKQ